MTRRRKSPKHSEQRAQDVSWALTGSQFGTVPSAVSTRLAEGLSVVTAAVQAISSGIAATPTLVYRIEGDGRTIDEQHPLQQIIRNGANQYQTWPDLIEWLVASILLRGNGLTEVVSDSRGRLTELMPHPWESAAVQMLPSGRLAYDVSDVVSIYGGTGRRRRLLQDQVLHVRDRSDDGIIGRSRLSRAAAVISTALDGQEFAGSIYRRGAFPSGAVLSEKDLGPSGRKGLREALSEVFSGPNNAGRILVFDRALKWQPISISPEDAELLASRRFTGEELARIFQVPPPVIGDLSHGTFTNSAEAGRWFVMHCLRPWCRKLEAAIARACFTEAELQTHSIEFDLSDLLRGDPETRWRSNQIAVDSGILTPNEIRHQEGWNPHADGNTLARRNSAPNPNATPTPGQ